MADTAVLNLDLVDYSANLNHTCDGATLAMNLLTSGTYSDTTGSTHCVYPSPWVWPATPVVTYLQADAPAGEKPHETVQRCMRDIAHAAHDLQRAAEQMGVPVDRRALEEALVEKLRAAL